MSTLQQVFKNVLGPYKPKLSLTVVATGEVRHYKMEGEDRQVRSAVLVDENEDLVRVNLYDKTKFPRLVVGNVFALINIITKLEDGVRIICCTKNSKIFCGKVVDVSEALRRRGDAVLNPPSAETVVIKAALASPPRTKVSVQGEIVQEGDTQSVTVRGQDVPIKAIHIEDRSAIAKITLWREADNADVRPGDFVLVTDVVTNTYKSETTLSTTSRSTIKKCDAPLERLSGSVVGVSLNEDDVELLMATDDVITVETSLVYGALVSAGRDEVPIEELTKEGPVDVKYSVQAEHVIEFEIDL